MKKTLTITLLVLFTVGLVISCNSNSVESLFQKEEKPTAPKYTVAFDMQGHGTQIATMTDIVSGSKITEPTDPTATDYVFGGWYKEATCTNAWNFDTDKIMSNTTLYAKWVNKADYTLKSQDSWFTTLTSGTDIIKDSVSAIIFRSSLPDGVNGKGVDVTDNETGNVKGYIVGDGNSYKIYIVGDYIYGNADCNNMFKGFLNLMSLDFGDFDTSNVTQMGQMFLNCSKLNSLNLSKFNTSKVTVFYFMFKNCSSLKSLEFDNFVKFETANMSSMFQMCTELIKVKINTPDENLEDQLWGGWNYEDGYYNKVNKCVAEIIALNIDFPTSEQSSWKNDNGWGIFYKSDWLHIKRNDNDSQPTKGKDAVTIFDGGYECTNGDNITVRFNVTGGNLTSIDVSGDINNSYKNGTYAPSSPSE